MKAAIPEPPAVIRAYSRSPAKYRRLCLGRSRFRPIRARPLPTPAKQTHRAEPGGEQWKGDRQWYRCEQRRIERDAIFGGESEETFTLSDKIDQDGISAELDDGVLTLTLKKSREALPRRIAIK
jgi:hypothetical protein